MRALAIFTCLGLLAACGADGPPAVPGGSSIAEELF